MENGGLKCNFASIKNPTTAKLHIGYGKQLCVSFCDKSLSISGMLIVSMIVLVFGNIKHRFFLNLICLTGMRFYSQVNTIMVMSSIVS